MLESSGHSPQAVNDGFAANQFYDQGIDGRQRGLASQTNTGRFNGSNKTAPDQSAVSAFESLLGGGDEGTELDSLFGATGKSSSGLAGSTGRPVLNESSPFGNNTHAADHNLRAGLADKAPISQQGNATNQGFKSVLADKAPIAPKANTENQSAFASNALHDTPTSETGAQTATIEPTVVGSENAVELTGDDFSITHQNVTTNTQSANTAEAKISLSSSDRSAEVTKLAAAFHKELGNRDLHSVKTGTLNFKLGDDAFPGTSIKVQVENGQTVVDIQSVDPDVDQFLRDARADLNRELGPGVAVRVQERGQQSGEQRQDQQQQEEPSDEETEVA